MRVRVLNGLQNFFRERKISFLLVAKSSHPKNGKVAPNRIDSVFSYNMIIAKYNLFINKNDNNLSGKINFPERKCAVEKMNQSSNLRTLLSREMFERKSKSQTATKKRIKLFSRWMRGAISKIISVNYRNYQIEVRQKILWTWMSAVSDDKMKLSEYLPQRNLWYAEEWIYKKHIYIEMCNS